MRQPIEKRLNVIKALLSGAILVFFTKATKPLSCSRRNIERYRKVFVQKGKDGLKDHRYSNYQKLSGKQKKTSMTKR
ncbi:MAG: hypothetical protein HYU80_04110 [Candidatus Blackburnbacteria bacterium]|nr:hypothetical protein [Candidatus Blackburnbacteria bacterium]